MKRAKKTFAEKAYVGTTVDKEYTQGQIHKMLEQLGITQVAIARSGQDYAVEFYVKLQRDESSRKIRINIPIHSDLGDKPIDTERRKNILFRVLYYHLKDKFVVVQRGLKEFEEEFLADLVVISNGVETRLGDLIVPQYKEQLKNSKMAVISKI